MKGASVKSSSIQYDGPMPMVIHSALLDLVTAVTEQAAVLIEQSMTIKSIRSMVRVAAGTASGTAYLGTIADPNAYAEQAHATTDAAGTLFDWTLILATIPENTVVVWGADGGSTSTGSVDCTAILVPLEDA